MVCFTRKKGNKKTFEGSQSSSINFDYKVTHDKEMKNFQLNCSITHQLYTSKSYDLNLFYGNS